MLRNIISICFVSMLLILGLYGCHNKERPSLIICFVDYSESALSSRSYYQDQLQKIGDTLKPGDRILLFRITDKTQTDAIPILDSGEYPRSSMIENPIIYKQQCEEFKSRFVAKIQSAYEDINSGNISKYTDILGVFVIAEDIVSDLESYNAKLIILSDGLNDSILLGRRYNFEKDKINDKYCSDLINTLEQNNLIPKLPGVSVYFIGVSSAQGDKNDERLAEVRKFWQTYIEHTGAKLKGYGKTGLFIQ